MALGESAESGRRGKITWFEGVWGEEGV